MVMADGLVVMAMMVMVMVMVMEMLMVMEDEDEILRVWISDGTMGGAQRVRTSLVLTAGRSLLALAASFIGHRCTYLETITMGFTHAITIT